MYSFVYDLLLGLLYTLLWYAASRLRLANSLVVILLDNPSSLQTHPPFQSQPNILAIPHYSTLPNCAQESSDAHKYIAIPSSHAGCHRAARQ